MLALHCVGTIHGPATDELLIWRHVHLFRFSEGNHSRHFQFVGHVTAPNVSRHRARPALPVPAWQATGAPLLAAARGEQVTFVAKQSVASSSQAGYEYRGMTMACI